MAIVSIHAPTQGATSDVSTPFSPQTCFNPRAHAGRDTARFNTLHQIIVVSIHAPTQGATPNFPSTVIIILVSIHAPTQGATSLHQSEP